MAHPFTSRTFFSLLLASLTLTPFLLGQKSQPSQTVAKMPSKSQAAGPVTMTECEGTNNCATWTFLGAQGNGQWPSGEIANLTVEHYDDNSVVIRRADSTGSSAGLTSVYTGTRHGDRVGGEFTSSWPGHWDTKSGNWYATVEKTSESLPPNVMHFCASNCFTLTLDADRKHFIAKNDSGVAFSTWTIESFTRESVLLHRRDAGGFDVTYAGQISKEGGSLINQTANGNFDTAGITWGSKLNTIPGSNAERDSKFGRPQQQQRVIVSPVVVCVPWFFGVVCGG